MSKKNEEIQMDKILNINLVKNTAIVEGGDGKKYKLDTTQCKIIVPKGAAKEVE